MESVFGDAKLILDKELKTLLRKHPNNGHIQVEPLHLAAYIRVTRRAYKGKIVDTVEIGSVEVQEKHRNQGCCSMFLRIVEQIAEEMGRKLFVECVHSEILRGMLERRKYEKDGSSTDNHYWK